MKRRTLLGTISATATVFIAGCGDGGDGDNVSDGNDTEPVVGTETEAMDGTETEAMGGTETETDGAGAGGGTETEAGAGTETETGAGTETEAGAGTETETGAGTETTAGGGSGAVQVADNEEYGEILVDADGMTLYIFQEDTQGESSACTGSCTENWPPLEAQGSDPEAGEGVTAELTTIEREDGTMQVAVDGWPLYHYVEDESPGDANGQGVGDVWWVVAPDGTPVGPEQ